MQVIKHASKGIHLGFEKQRDVISSPKQGYQWLHKKTYVHQKFFKKGFVPSLTD